MTDAALPGEIRDRVAAARAELGRGNLDGAADMLAGVLDTAPHHHDALHLLGVISLQVGRAEDALHLIERALQTDPDRADAWANLATAALACERLDVAEQAQRRAIEIDPEIAAFRFNLGNILVARGNLPAGIDAFRAALAIQTNFPEAWNNLGTALRDLENVDDACGAFREACHHKPDYFEARYNYANALRDLGQLTAAETEIRRAIALRPDHAKAFNSLGNMLSDMARPVKARDAFRKSTECDPTWMPAASNLLSSEQYVPGVAAAALAAQHEQWAQRFASALTPTHHKTTDLVRSPDWPLRIGFVSPDFGIHPVGFLTVRMFEHLDGQCATPMVFSTRPLAREDDISRRIAAKTAWINADGLSDQHLAEKIVQERIDILFDMSGHTAGHRLLTFARKPSPIQISWLGYVGTTGLPSMDFILADKIHAPPNERPHGPEQYLRMPHGYVCYDPPLDAPDVDGLPFDRNSHITFGCLNNPAKLNDEVIAAFARIMTQVPGSRMILRFKGLEDDGVQTDLHSRFATHGIDAGRLTILGRATHREFLATYNQIDIALDTFPYSGGLTTCEALWMGAPVVTFPGATFAGRHASSHLTTAGLNELIFKDQAEFERGSIALANDPAKLRDLRQGLRARMAASPLCDGARFAEDFVQALRDALQAQHKNALN